MHLKKAKKSIQDMNAEEFFNLLEISNEEQRKKILAQGECSSNIILTNNKLYRFISNSSEESLERE